MKILVTGGAGFIGSHIVEYHLEKGDEVWAVDCLLTGRKDNIQPFLNNSKFRFDEADLQGWQKLGEAVQWADRIYHMAAVLGQRLVLSDPVGTLSKNIHSFEVVLEAMARYRTKNRILLASSSGVYANMAVKPQEKLVEDSALLFQSGAYLQESYYISKLVNETMALAYRHQHQIQVTIARLFNTVGTRQTGRYGMVVPSFVGQAIRNEPITVFGDGNQTRSFCNVLDSVTAMDLLMDTSASLGQIVNVGNDVECSINHLANLVKERAHSRSEITHTPYKEAYGVDFHDVKVRKPNIEKLHKLTGFRPKWTLEQTVDQVIQSLTAKV